MKKTDNSTRPQGKGESQEIMYMFGAAYEIPASWRKMKTEINKSWFSRICDNLRRSIKMPPSIADDVLGGKYIHVNSGKLTPINDEEE